MSRNYASGDRPIPFTVAALLRLMIARRISPATLERLNAEDHARWPEDGPAQHQRGWAGPTPRQ
jgi:hypothetical protein